MTEPAPFLDFHATKMLHTAQGRALLDIRFQLAKGETLAIYGPSGAGKTTLLRILAGLTDTQSGHIRVAGDTWLDSTKRTRLPTRHRAIGLVFQDFALFPNLTVRQQLEYALPKHQDKSIIAELLSLMELEALQHHRPMLLSGGQQQRVALARAIARRPTLLLLDEPLSALDDEMRDKLQEYILKVQQRYHLTTILVSHYLPEIFRLADTALVLRQGRILRHGTPADLFGPEVPAASFTNRAPATGISREGIILNITRSGNICSISLRCADSVINIFVSPEEAANFSIGQTITFTLSASHSTIAS